jgi:hypothetical protein
MYFKTVKSSPSQKFYERLPRKLEKLCGNMKPTPAAPHKIQHTCDGYIHVGAIWSLDEYSSVFRQQFPDLRKELQRVPHVSENVPNGD